MIDAFVTPWGGKVFSFTTLDSTSRHLWRLAENGAADGTVVVADQQTAGCGRRGRQWHSPAGLNLYFSLLLRPRIELEKLPQLSLVTAAALWQVLHQDCPDLMIKWPNDLLCCGLKLAGILAEMKPAAAGAEFVIIGAGINANAEIDDFPQALRGQVTSLKNESGKTVALDLLLAKLLAEMDIFIELFAREGLGGSIRELINRNFYLADKAIVVNSGNKKINCRARRIDRNGSLVASLADGSLCSFNAGEAWLAKTNQEF